MMFNKKIIVSRIVDGDTFVCNQGLRYRLSLIDTPEHGQPYSKEATKLLSSLVLNKTISIKVISIDKYKRKVVQCWVKRVDVNRELVIYGLACVDKRFLKTNTHEYLKLEKAAKRKKIGIWESKQVKPWDYRAKRKGVSFSFTLLLFFIALAMICFWLGFDISLEQVFKMNSPSIPRFD